MSGLLVNQKKQIEDAARKLNHWPHPGEHREKLVNRLKMEVTIFRVLVPCALEQAKADEFFTIPEDPDTSFVNTLISWGY